MSDIDVLIVGGGPSGTYCAWRLAQAYPNLKIILVEKCGFLGGRLQSVPFGNNQIYAEVGGMRTFPASDILLAAVLKRLAIQTVAVPYNEPTNIAFVKNKRFSYSVFSSPVSNTIEREVLISIYHLPCSERNIAIPNLIADAASSVDPNYSTNPISVFTYPQLNNTTFSDFLRKNHISEGAIEALGDFSGYDFATVSPTAASVGIREDLSLSGTAQQYFIVGGYNTLVFRLAAAAKAASKNFQIMLSTKLQSVTQTTDNQFICSLKNAKSKFNITAKSVILAIPKKNLDQVSAPWTNLTLQAFSSIYTWIGFKAFLRVDQQTYNMLSRNGELVGRNISDLPARQIWFYSSQPPCLLVYCDQEDAVFWKKYMYPENEDFCVFPRWHDPSYNISLVQELKKQIATVFGVCSSNINVTDILYKYWDGGAYFWKPSNIPLLETAVQKPLGSDKRVYIVGSDFSFYQGWVEGALESADQVLAENFGLKPLVNVPKI